MFIFCLIPIREKSYFLDFPFKLTKLWNERWIRKDFSLPLKNRYICRKFEIISDPSDTFDEPSLVFKNDSCKVFFKNDQKFQLPHGFIFAHFQSPLTKSSAINLNMTSIFSMCVKNFLAEKLYPATFAGYNYRLNSVEDGLVLKTSGFDEKLPSILDVATKALQNTDEVIDKLSFDVFKKELRKNCYNVIINSTLFNE